MECRGRLTRECRTAGSIVAGAVLTALVCSAEVQPRGGGVGTPARSSGVITVAGTPHPYLTEGNGFPCIVVGLAPSYQPLFSRRLKQSIRFIFVDFKNTWGADVPGDINTISIDTLVDEIEQVRRSFRLDKVCVVGHSLPGLLALEYTARHPDRVSHSILIGLPPFHNRDLAKMQTRFWESDASADRKAALQRNIERLPDATLRSLSPRDAFAMRYVRTGPKYFYDPSYDFSWAWVGRHFSAEMLNRYFGVILADYDPRPRLSRNTVPIFLALGRYDYAVPSGIWNGVKEHIPRLTSYLFERSGHFPMLEESDRFDELVIRWLERVR